MPASKQEIASEFLAVAKRLFIDANLSDATRVENFLGLFTKDELIEVMRRDQIKTAIQVSLDENASFSVQGIADQCAASSETVLRVWGAMRDEYPTDTSPRSTFKMALPKETRAYQIVEAILVEAGFRVEIEDKRLGTGSIIDMKNGLQPIPFQIIRGQDIPIYMKEGIVQASFVGNDRLREIISEEERKEVSPLVTDILASFRENSFRMCVAVPKDKQQEAEKAGLNYLNGKFVVTSYPETLKSILSANGITPKEIKYLKGGVEQSIVNFGADAIMDIVETGGSLKKSNLVVLGNPLYAGSMDLFKLAETQLTPENTLRIEKFRQRLLQGSLKRPQVAQEASVAMTVQNG